MSNGKTPRDEVELENFLARQSPLSTAPPAACAAVLSWPIIRTTSSADAFSSWMTSMSCVPA